MYDGIRIIHVRINRDPPVHHPDSSIELDSPWEWQVLTSGLNNESTPAIEISVEKGKDFPGPIATNRPIFHPLEQLVSCESNNRQRIYYVNSPGVFLRSLGAGLRTPHNGD